MTSAIDEIKKAKENGRVSHAYILSSGTEKERVKFAFAFARIIISEELSSNDPDVKWIRADENKTVISIKTVREEVIPFISKAPYRHEKKILVIENGECLNKESSNALLKTLEEPSESSIILILISDENKLISTIKSRAVSINLGKRNKIIDDDIYYGGRDIVSKVLKGSSSYMTIKWTEGLLYDSKKKLIKTKQFF